MTNVASVSPGSTGSWAERFLGFVSGDEPDRFRGHVHLIAMLAFHVGCRQLHLAVKHGEPAFVVSGLIAVAVSGGCLIEARGERLHYAPLGLVAAAGIFAFHKVALGNHAAMETLLLVAAALSVPIVQDRVAVFSGFVRWSCILLFLNSGLQKVIYGGYFNGSFLARQIGNDRFGWVLELALPREEFLRLMATNRMESMVFSSATGILLSNVVYLTEIGCALLLFFPRTRALGFYAGILTVLGIEVVAREVGFGFMFILMLLLFRPGLLESRRILLLPIAAHLVLGLVEFAKPGWLLW